MKSGKEHAGCLVAAPRCLVPHRTRALTRLDWLEMTQQLGLEPPEGRTHCRNVFIRSLEEVPASGLGVACYTRTLGS